MAEAPSPFHDSLTAEEHRGPRLTAPTRQQIPSYRFVLYEHPYAGQLARRLVTTSVAGLQAADTEVGSAWEQQLFDSTRYGPTDLVAGPYPSAKLDFDEGGPYAVYNLELFFHLPLTIALHLSRNQRYNEAQRWLHHIFDPTDDSDGPTPQRFWKVSPFRTTQVELIQDLLLGLAAPEDSALKQCALRAIRAWQEKPFSPHTVARTRPSAYMLRTVMAYLDNLIAWGDSLFREDSGESINEATQLYVLAANVLGVRPQEVPRKASAGAKSYAELRETLDGFSNALVALETDFPFDLMNGSRTRTPDDRVDTLRTLGGAALYFCVPPNEKLLGYWDTVADRLFKIRNSLNLQGTFRQLPLFEPPIDPGLLARATAAGVDVGAVVSGLSSPMPLVRFPVLSAKATEICQEVKALGAHLLSALEKEDAEALSLLRARHEKVILGLAEGVRYRQWQESIKAREAVERSLATSMHRYRYYQTLLGQRPEEIVIPELDALNEQSLGRGTYAQAEPDVPQRPLRSLVSDGAEPGTATSHLSSQELEELAQLQYSHDASVGASYAEAAATILKAIPELGTYVMPFGLGVKVAISGETLSAISAGTAVGLRQVAADHSHSAGGAARIGGYERRDQEWSFQSDLAAGEINATFKQLRAAQLREAIAKNEWSNAQKQIEQADEIQQFLTDDRTGKRTNKEFYGWLTREARGLHAQCFQFAFDVARKAERALQHELGDPGQRFLQTTYLTGRQGLFAGEKLALDLKRMEVAYTDLNAREYELTKHVSLRQLDPRALLQLRATGSCSISLPEELFDLDCPGHYFRRIKTVAVSIPCVVGPYAGVNCTLTQLRSSLRISPQAASYTRNGEDTARFRDNFGNSESIVTSTAQNDTGLFETTLRDERYLPFEGSGAISEWTLELPAAVGPNAVPQFDHDTIADVILHLRYTARDGGQPLRDAALDHLRRRIDAATAAGSVVLLSARHEFPTEWARFRTTREGETTTRAPLTLPLRDEHYPFWSRIGNRTIRRIDLFAQPGTGTARTVTVSDQTGTAAGMLMSPADGSFGSLLVGAYTAAVPADIGPFTMQLSDNSLTDLWIAIAWGRGQSRP